MSPTHFGACGLFLFYYSCSAVVFSASVECLQWSFIGFFIHFKIPEFMIEIYLSDIHYNLIGIPKVVIFLISVLELWLCLELF